MPVFYAGIGSRKTPADILERMNKFAKWAEARGLILRSGGAKGADSAFERDITLKQIFLPTGNTPEWAYRIAVENHPNWAAFEEKPYEQDLMARNTLQVYGPSIGSTKSAFVLCWTKDGAEKRTSRETGGTGQAIRIANALNIPVFNLKNEGADRRLMQHLAAIGVNKNVTLSESEIAELAKIWCTEFIPQPDLIETQKELFFNVKSEFLRVGQLFSKEMIDAASKSVDDALQLLVSDKKGREATRGAIAMVPKRWILLPGDFAEEVRDSVVKIARRLVNFAWDMALQRLNVSDEVKEDALFRNWPLLRPETRNKRRDAYMAWQKKKKLNEKIVELEAQAQAQAQPSVPVKEPEVQAAPKEEQKIEATGSKVAPYAQMLLDGATDAEVAELAGVRKETVAAYRKRHGIPGRSAADRKQARQATEG